MENKRIMELKRIKNVLLVKKVLSENVGNYLVPTNNPVLRNKQEESVKLACSISEDIKEARRLLR